MTPVNVHDKPLNHKIWGIAGPMILANVSVPLLGLVDTAILGHLDNARYLAAVAIGSTLLSFLYWGFGFLRMGTTGASAQSRHRPPSPEVVLLQAMLLALAIACIILLGARHLIPVAIHWMNTPAESQVLAEQYLSIRLYSAPAVLLNYAIVGWLLGQQQARWPLIIALVTNGLNIGLDWLLIIHWHGLTEGAARASVIAEYSGLLVGLFAVRHSIRQWPVDRQWWRNALISRQYGRFISANRHLFFRTLLLLGAFAFFTAQGARLGTEILAANAILLQLVFFSAHGLDGFAHASEALSGDAVGARSRRYFYAVCKGCAYWTGLTALAISVFFWLAQEPVIATMSDIQSVRQLASSYYFWLVLMPVVSAASYLLDGIFIGALHTRWMFYTMMLSVVAVFLPVWYLTLGLGNHGLWLSFIAFNAARGISLSWVFLRLSRQNRWWDA